MTNFSSQTVARERLATGRMQDDIQQLHDRCGVYTQPDLVRRTLDACGWVSGADLADACLLEPCAGDGAFLKEATDRLLESLRLHGHRFTLEILQPRILAFELMKREASKARRSIVRLLVAGKVRRSVAEAIASQWIQTGDFLLDRPEGRRFTHVVGNPPYVRWAKVPASLRGQYENALPSSIAQGDLQLPFLSVGVDVLKEGGKLGFICSDRWRHMQYGAAFKSGLEKRATVRAEPVRKLPPPFSRSVDAYADMLIITKIPPSADKVLAAPAIVRRWTLADMGCTVRVGPALGCNAAFAGKKAELPVEAGLLARLVKPSHIQEGAVTLEDSWVIAMHDGNRRLRNLGDFPQLRKHLSKFREKLEKRSVVAAGGPWYRPIDTVQKSVWASPKLLIPEIAKVPRIALDESGGIPSHAVYAIMGPLPVIRSVNEGLSGGGLAEALEPIAPKIKGGYVRCYKRFLEIMTF